MKSILIVSIFTLAVNQVDCVVKFSEIVELPSGKIRGTINEWRNRLAYEFKGIPYAAPPIFSLRFVEPKEPESWREIKDTISYGKSCPQGEINIKWKDQDEDCLFLNVYVNKETFDNRHSQLKPVLFFIHGGGFWFGSGNEHDAYKGIPLVIVEDVLLVTFNYRLGPFGFLNPRNLVPSIVPNLGFWDQNFALHWVQRNIHLFGGDPDQVTIFGQSAGSSGVAHQILSPQSRGLFKGAIMESGGVVIKSTPEDLRIESIRDMIKALNCSQVTDKLTCLQSIPWEIVFNNRPQVWSEREIFLAPIYGDDFFPTNPEYSIATRQFNDVNLLVGGERDEREGLLCGTYQFAVLKASKSNRPTYGYIHTQAPLLDFNKNNTFCGKKADKVCHCDELPYVFGAPLREPESYDADDVEASLGIMRIWADFARTGKPTKQGPIEWPQIKTSTSDKLNLIELNSKFVGKIDHVTGTSCLEQ